MGHSWCPAMQWWSCSALHPPACTSLHSCTGMWSNKLPAPSPLPCRRHHHRYHRHHLTSAAAIATEAPLSQIKETEKARNYRGGKLCRRSTKRGFMLAHIHSQRKKEGHPFKCGAAALIYWVKMGERRSCRGQIAESFFIHPHGCDCIIINTYKVGEKKK